MRDANLDVTEGEAVGLVGESGSGKSMTAKCILGILPPGVRLVEGTVIYKERPLDL